MFERFTDRARRVVVLAQEEARSLGHSYIGTEHILLGLISEGEGVAARVLEQVGISRDEVRAKVQLIIGEAAGSPSGHIPFTPRAKKVLELSLREALQLGHNYIGTEHILLGLIREGQGVAAQVLTDLGADLSLVRQHVIRELGGLRGRGPGAPSPPTRETPAMLKSRVEARRLAGGKAVGSHHQLLALLADEESMAGKALAALGVTAEAVKARIDELDPAGTSDETAEEAGARRIRMRVQDKVLSLEIDDPALAESLEKALAGHEARIISGTDPEAEAAGFPNVWSAVSRTVDDLTRRLVRRQAMQAAHEPEWRPPASQEGAHAGIYWIARTSAGLEGHLDVSDADPADVRAWLRDWLATNGPSINAAADVEVLWAYVDRAGQSFAMASFGFGANGPPGSEPVPLEILVRDALVDLGAAA